MTREKRRPASDTWQPDLLGGLGIQRADSGTSDQLGQARQEMRSSGSADLFDAIADAPVPQIDALTPVPGTEP